MVRILKNMHLIKGTLIFSVDLNLLLQLFVFPIVLLHIKKQIN